MPQWSFAFIGAIHLWLAFRRNNTSVRTGHPVGILNAVWGIGYVLFGSGLVSYIRPVSVGAALYLEFFIVAQIVGAMLGASIVLRSTAGRRFNPPSRVYFAVMAALSLVCLLTSAYGVVTEFGSRPEIDLGEIRIERTSEEAQVPLSIGIASYIFGAGYMLAIMLPLYWSQLSRTWRIISVLGSLAPAVYGAYYVGRGPLTLVICSWGAAAFLKQLLDGNVGVWIKRRRRWIVAGVIGYIAVMGWVWNGRQSSVSRWEKIDAVVEGDYYTYGGMIGWQYVPDSLRNVYAGLGVYATQSVPNFGEFFDMDAEVTGRLFSQFWTVGLVLKNIGVPVQTTDQIYEDLKELYHRYDRTAGVFCTWARDCIMDFGYIGALLFVFGFGIICGKSYKRTLVHRSVLAGLIYAYCVFTILFSVMFTAIPSTIGGIGGLWWMLAVPLLYGQRVPGHPTQAVQQTNMVR